MIKFKTVAGKFVFFSFVLVIFTALVFALTVADMGRRTLSAVKEVNQTVLREAVQKEWEQKCRDLTKLLAYELTQPLLDLDVGSIDDHVSSALREVDVRYLYVHDENGGVLFGAGEGSGTVGQIFTDVISRNAVATRELLTQKQIGIVDIGAPVFFGSRKLGTVRVGFSTARIESSTTKLNQELRGRIGGAITAALRNTLVAVLIISAATAMVGFLSVRKLLQPVRMLALGTQRLAAGDLGFRLPITSVDEIGQLAHSFNQMSEDLQRTTVSRDYVDNVVSSMIDMLVVIDVDAVIKTVNKAACELLEYQEEELKGKPLSSIMISTRDDKHFLKELKGGACKRIIRNVERVYLSKSGKQIPVLFSGSPMHAGDGALQGMVCLAQDISERKRAEEARRISEERNRALLASLPQRVFFKDKESRFVSVNDAFAADLGMQPDDLIGKTDYDFAPSDLARKYQEDDIRVMTTRACETLEERNVVNGQERYVEVIKAPVIREDGGVMGILGLFTDITARRQSEEALRNSELLRRATIDNLLEGLATINEAGIIETVNPAAEKMFGYTGREMIGQHLTMLLADDRARDTVEFMKLLRETGVGRAGEWEAQRSDNTTFPIELTLSEFCVLEGKHFIANIRDLSERREVDRLKKEFVSTVSHELRTPLTSIRGSLTLLAAGALGRIPEEATEVIALAERNTIRLITLINDILDLERLESGKLEMNFENVLLSSVLKASVESIQSFADQEQITIELPSEEAEIFADQGRLVQVMVNLLSNAVKFSERGSTVAITCREVPGWVEVSVADSGCGIPAPSRRMIFERFRQVESHDSRQKGGTGLGLTICKAIIEQHGGTIGLESEEGKGSTFWIRVPAGLRKQDFVQRQVSDIATKQTTSPILVGDPDPAIRRHIESILKKEGHDVVVGSSADETWDILRKSAISMAILDTVLVEYADQELIKEVLGDSKLHHIPLIMMGETLSPESLSQNVALFIPKPVNEEQLLEAIRDTLRKSGRRDVLLVEDDEVLLQVMARQLGQEGIAVRTATTGRQAVAMALQATPGLMVLDVGLPDGDGFDVVDALRREPELKRIPLLVYTGRDLTAEQRGQLTLGATRFLTKSEATDEQFRSLVVNLFHKSIDAAASS